MEESRFIFWWPCRAEIDQRMGVKWRRIPAPWKDKQATDQRVGKWTVRAVPVGGGSPSLQVLHHRLETHLVEVAVIEGDVKGVTGQGLNTCPVSAPSTLRPCALGQDKHLC